MSTHFHHNNNTTPTPDLFGSSLQARGYSSHLSPHHFASDTQGSVPMSSRVDAYASLAIGVTGGYIPYHNYDINAAVYGGVLAAIVSAIASAIPHCHGARQGATVWANTGQPVAYLQASCPFLIPAYRGGASCPEAPRPGAAGPGSPASSLGPGIAPGQTDDTGRSGKHFKQTKTNKQASHKQKDKQNLSHNQLATALTPQTLSNLLVLACVLLVVLVLVLVLVLALVLVLVLALVLI